MDGALLINKHAGVSSFGVIEQLQRVLMKHPGAYGRVEPFARKRELPKMGHGGTLDPFATGLLAVCVGRGVKLARYFLGSRKTYEGVIRFGETTVPGDPTAPVSETSSALPSCLEQVQAAARSFESEPYFQIPPMHSAKKVDGKALYELAREGIEIEREPRKLQIYSFEIFDLEPGTGSADANGAGHPVARARFRVECSSGTYVRTLAKDLAAKLGTVAMLDTLHRVASGAHALEGDPALGQARAMTVEEIALASEQGKRWDELPAWMPFDKLLDGYDRAEATDDEATALFQGKQAVLPRILSRAQDAAARAGSGPLVIYRAQSLVAIARQDHGVWGLERVFLPEGCLVSSSEFRRLKKN